LVQEKCQGVKAFVKRHDDDNDDDDNDNIFFSTSVLQGHTVAQLVEALSSTSRKVAGLIPDAVIGIFH
jgi:hypothetical protein